MARAIVLQIDGDIVPAAGDTDDVRFLVRFAGADLVPIVGSSRDNDYVTVNLNLVSDTTAQIGTKIANAVRARATERGFTIPNNQGLAPTWAKF